MSEPYGRKRPAVGTSVGVEALFWLIRFSKLRQSSHGSDAVLSVAALSVSVYVVHLDVSVEYRSRS